MRATSDLASNTTQDFSRMIASFSAATTTAEQEKTRRDIWQQFGTTGAAFVSDMANFSRTSRDRGVCHFLKMIHRTRNTISPIISDNNGLLLKFEADNCYAYFENPNDALDASREVNAELVKLNQASDAEEQIYLSVGIDYGRLLLVGEKDYYGDPVNTASKLGEDLAGRNEILVTERALAKSDYVTHDNGERLIARVSDIEIHYVRLIMAENISS